MRYLLCLLIYILSQPVMAIDDYMAIANEAIANKEHQMAPYRADALKALKQAENIVNKINVANNKSSNSVKTPQIIIFVSFSMPDESLEAYLRDAKKINAAVVIRGLYQNSFKMTFARVSQLIKSSGGSGVELNPLLFKKFTITTVPSIVILPSENNCLKQSSCDVNHNFDKLSGNITLASALKLLRDRGEVSQLVADKGFVALQGGTHA